LIAFNAPLVLFALIALPVIYWLLRVLPPSPRRVPFPAVRLLFGLRSEEETPAHTPPWLMALRMLIAGLVILALAQPVVNPVAGGGAGRPLLLVLDDDWASAVDWPLRREVALDRVAQAARDDRLVALARTSPTPIGDPPPVIGPQPAREVLPLVEEFEPRPWPADRAALAAPLAALPFATTPEVVWIANGLADTGDADGGEDGGFAATLQSLGPLTVLLGDRTAPLLVLDDRPGPRLIASIAAAEPLAATATVRARAGDGRLLAQAPVELNASDPRRGTATVDLPTDALNRIARLELDGPPTAGGVALVDRRWQHHGIGIVSIGDPGLYPLLSPLHYVDRAIQPFSEPLTGDVETLTAGNAAVDVILATDEGLPGVDARRELDAWIEDGGIFVQFAGPRLAEATDALVPVALRTGDRLLSGSMSWTEPMSLAPFPPGSPFAGLEVPDDVVVNRQVLAQPGPELAEHTWAQLADGTPLVTAARQGEGWLVLVHVSARPDWSTLPLSGLFVEMLQRITELSDGQEVAGSSLPLAPRASLDAFGRLTDPPPAARPLPAEPATGIVPGPQHPPGLYGTEGGVTRAFNLGG
ncbi:MAG: BatA domain-containing protein, partial [Rhodospirillaceae bacterium]|nr:BatA domain-containing protein [Rhodospirillaceae bacterium]